MQFALDNCHFAFVIHHGDFVDAFLHSASHGAFNLVAHKDNRVLGRRLPSS